MGSGKALTTAFRITRLHLRIPNKHDHRNSRPSPCLGASPSTGLQRTAHDTLRVTHALPPHLAEPRPTPFWLASCHPPSTGGPPTRRRRGLRQDHHYHHTAHTAHVFRTSPHHPNCPLPLLPQVGRRRGGGVGSGKTTIITTPLIPHTFSVLPLITQTVPCHSFHRWGVDEEEAWAPARPPLSPHRSYRTRFPYFPSSPKLSLATPSTGGASTRRRRGLRQDHHYHRFHLPSQPMPLTAPHRSYHTHFP